MNKSDLLALEKVESYIEKLEPAVKDIVIAITHIILKVSPLIKQRIKWNSPSFHYTGEMEAFNAKEYKSDIAVFNLNKNRILLILPNGATIKKEISILEGNYTDGRRIIHFKDLNEVLTKKEALTKIIKESITNIEKK